MSLIWDDPISLRAYALWFWAEPALDYNPHKLWRINWGDYPKFRAAP